MVTGKNRKEFKKWYESQRMNFDDIYSIPYDVFMAYNICFQIGVYLAYYDSKEFHLSLDFINSKCYEVQIINSQLDSVLYYSADTRNEAYKAAFEKADELINK